MKRRVRMKRIIVLLSMTLLFAILLSSCGVSPETAIQNAQEYVAVNDYVSAESELLSVLEKEPENVLIKEELGKLYRQQAVSMQSADEMLTCFEKAQNYIEGFEYTKEELDTLASISVEGNSKETEVFIIVQQAEANNQNIRIDEMIYDALGKAAIVKCEDDVQKKELLDNWLEKDPTNANAVCLKAVVELGIDKITYDESGMYEEMMDTIAEYEGTYAMALFEIDDEKGYIKKPYNKCVYDESNRLLFARSAYYDGVDRANTVFGYEGSNLVSLVSNGNLSFDLYYDENNNLICVEKEGETLSVYEYDEQNRLIYKEYMGGWGNWTKYEYDETGNYTMEYYGYDEYEGRYYSHIDEITITIDDLSLEFEETIDLSYNVDTLNLSDGNVIEIPGYYSAGNSITVSKEQYMQAHQSAFMPERAGLIYTIQYNGKDNIEIKYDEFGLVEMYIMRSDDYTTIEYIHTLTSEDGKILYRIPISIRMESLDNEIKYEYDYMYDSAKYYVHDSIRYIYEDCDSRRSIEIYFLPE